MRLHAIEPGISAVLKIKVICTVAKTLTFGLPGSTMLALKKCVSKCNNKRYRIFRNALDQKTSFNYRITRVCASFLICNKQSKPQQKQRRSPIDVATNV